MNEIMQNKYTNLKKKLGNYGSAIVAFSGGVDSTFLLKTARDSVSGQVIAVTARSKASPERELVSAVKFCETEGIRLIQFDFDIFSIDGFAQNPINRCYLCKTALLKRIWAIAEDENISTVLDGSNADDGLDYRPGMQALIEQGVSSPLKETGLSKEDIRHISREIGLDTWDKQSLACLITRIEYGETITEEKLRMVDQAEQYLQDLGFKQVRVRTHGNLARIELEENDLPGLFGEHRIAIHDMLKSKGFSYVTADIKGYRSGSMNETLFNQCFSQ